MRRVFKNEGIEFILHPGDHLEGMSGRPGHIYELSLIGYTDQMNRAVELYNSLETNIYGIDGNHDQWYAKKNDMGIIVGEELEKRVPQYINLGQDEGDLIIRPGITTKLFHAADGTAYADSYKLQKLIESFTGGEKPSLVLSGHYHKALYLHRRNVHGWECGTLCGQSRWMRGKKTPAHEGFGIVDLYMKDKIVSRIIHEWHPLPGQTYNKTKELKQ